MQMNRFVHSDRYRDRYRDRHRDRSIHSETALRAHIPRMQLACSSLMLLTCMAVTTSGSGRLLAGLEHHDDRSGRSIDHERLGPRRSGGRGSGADKKLTNPPVDNVTTADSWLNGAKKGFCGHTIAGSLHECRTSERGSIGLSIQAARSLRSAVRVCLNACAKCERCNYITVNPEVRDCSWYATCDMDHLQTVYDGFLSAPVVTLRHVAARASRGTASAVVIPKPQEVILFMHMEKTAGTVARSWFDQRKWNLTNYCASIPAIQGEVIKMLRANHKRIFVEHHCGLDW